MVVIANCWFFVSGKTKCDNTGRLKLPFFCAVGKKLNLSWVGLRVTKVRSVFFQGKAKLSVVFWSFVGGCVRRLTEKAWRRRGFESTKVSFTTKAT